MEHSEPATILNQQEQQHPDHQSDELGFQADQPTITDQLQADQPTITDQLQADQPTITDQLQALSVLPQDEEEGDCASKEGQLEEEEIKCDGDGQESWRSIGGGGNQSDEKQQTNSGSVIEERVVENEDVIGDEADCKAENGNRNGNGKGRDVELGAGGLVGRRETIRATQFPVRPDAEDCAFYLRTGTCKFGMNCKFNHPLKKKPLFYDQPGGCKYGKACKYSHNKHLELNFLGLPIRPGAKECPYYMRYGSCKYGSNCRFNHPDPSASERSDTLPMYSNGGPVSSQGGPQSPLAPWSPHTAMNDIASYMPLLFSPTQGISSSEWNSYQAPFYPSERNIHMSPAYMVNSPPLETTVYAQRLQMPVDEFPERPGQPECSYYLKNGDCKYKSACKFHHPKDRGDKTPSCALSDLGLPLRPGQIVCSHYSQYGICKFGPACKYDHPENYSHSDNSTASEPNQSPSVGNSLKTEGVIGVES